MLALKQAFGAATLPLSEFDENSNKLVRNVCFNELKSAYIGLVHIFGLG